MRINGAYYRTIWCESGLGDVSIIDQTHLTFEFKTVNSVQ